MKDIFLKMTTLMKWGKHDGTMAKLSEVMVMMWKQDKMEGKGTLTAADDSVPYYGRDKKQPA